MSNRYYPYLSSKERYKNPKECEKCHQHKPGFRLTWQVSWFRGDDEIEDLCDNCAAKEIEKVRKQEQDYLERKHRRRMTQEEFYNQLFNKLATKYDMEELNDYQWRVNGLIDIYPVNRKFHDIQSNKRGTYKDAHAFLKSFFGKDQNVRPTA